MNNDLPIREKLNLETATISWKEIELFFAQGKLLVIEPTEDLVKTAEIIAENAIGQLEKLVNQDKIKFATIEWVKQHCKDDTLLWAVVVSPYVLTQLKS